MNGGESVAEFTMCRLSDAVPDPRTFFLKNVGTWKNPYIAYGNRLPVVPSGRIDDAPG